MIMRVKDYMVKDVVTVKPKTTLMELKKVFDSHSFGAVPVVDGENNLLGLVTKRALLMVFMPDYLDMMESIDFVEDFGALESQFAAFPSLELFIVEDLMMKEPITITESASIFKAAALMEKYNIRRLPVVREAKLVGMITRSDVCKAFFANNK